MRRQRGILDKRGLHVLVSIISLTLTILLAAPEVAKGKVFNDAYSYEDSFDDSSGLNLAETYAFKVSDGVLLAEETQAVVVSECISLPQPAGSTFQGWSFLKIGIADLGAGSNNLEIQDCNGNTLKVITDLHEGESSIDLSDINDSAIRLVWTVNQAGAKLSFWNVYGLAQGATCIGVVPSSDTVNADETVTFTIKLSTSGAMARNPVLRFSLDDINGLHTPAVDDGLAEDAEVDYGTGQGVKPYRPLEFVSATRGPKGESPAIPTAGALATSGEVVWELNDLSDGFSDNVAVTLRVPKGYINGKTLAARAVLEHGLSSGAYTNRMSEEKTSGLVSVNSLCNSTQGGGGELSNLGPGATNNYDYYYTVNPSDMEDITLTITGTGTCTPLFRSVVAKGQYSYQIVSTPQVGAPITADDPVVVHFDRADFYSFPIMIYIYYDVPGDCGEGNFIGTQSKLVAGNPAWSNTIGVDHSVVFSACRIGSNYLHRVMSGNDPMSYFQWPAWPEYYLSNQASLRDGEYFTTWAPYGNEGNRSHTVPLDHSYNLVKIPDGISFHGVRDTGNLSRLYKDCTGTAPVPTDPAFNHNSTPPHPAWKPVDITWSGVPFSNLPDDNDPKAVVLGGCRMLGIKDNDNPAWQGPDNGIWHPTFLWRVCDGSCGCPELSEGTVMSLIGGTIYTYETATDPLGAVNQCYTYDGWTLYKELKSWPKVYCLPEKNQVPGGQMAHIMVNPENQNAASQWVDGRWVVNLYGIRDYIDLAGVTGEVLTQGLNVPAPSQNIIGESCAPSGGITFHFPDPAGCRSAASENDEACMAWWEVPAACQPPNGWGYPISGGPNHDEYKQIYRLRLNAPILNTTPANKVLDFVAQVRTDDLTAQGADNAVDPVRWPIANYAATTSVTVLDLPGLDVAMAGPASRKVGDTFTYTLELANYGNTPNDGWYLVDWLPRAGENSSEFTPEYGQVYVNQLPEEVIVEYCKDAACFTDPAGGTWTPVALQATSRPGYLAETVSSLGSLAPDAVCLRLRHNPAAAAHFNPGSTLLGAVDVIIPHDVSLEGKCLYNRALAGAAEAFGAASSVSSVETAPVRTKVSSEVVVEVEKTFQVDPTRAGWIKWMLNVHNSSGATASSIDLADVLPDELIYEGLAESLPAGWGCVQEPSVGDTGGQLHIMIDELSPDDGNPGGNDEGTAAFWSRVNEGVALGTVIKNCATAAPQSGVGDQSCTSIIVPNFEVTKNREAVDRLVNTPDIEVFPTDIIDYTITAANLSEHPVFFRIHDNLDEYVDYLAGTFTVNGATGSDSFISGGVLDYQYPELIDPGQTLSISFKVTVKHEAPNNQIIGNHAQITACTALLDPASCFSSIESLSAYVKVFCDETDNDHDGFRKCIDCDDATPDTYPGAVEQCDGVDNDCDGKGDEDFSNLGSSCTAGTGECVREGSIVCTEDGSGTACNAAPSEPAPEACDGRDNDCDGQVDEDFSNLGSSCTAGTGTCVSEGSIVCAEDGSGTACNAAPGEPAPEACDGRDNDCDGQVDEDFSNLASSCTAGTGECVSEGSIVCAEDGSGTACNAAPGEPAPEACDGRDNDCDGDVDEGVKSTYYKDGDGDTYGDPSMSIQACVAPPDYVENNNDCHDGDIAIHPDASEIPCNGKDDDCAGGDDTSNCPKCTVEDDAGALDIEGSKGRIGEEVRIPIRIQSAPNGVSSFGFDITYDPSILEYIGLERGDLANSFETVEAHLVDSGRVRVGGYTDEHTIPQGASGYLVRLKFRIIDGQIGNCYSLELERLKDHVAGFSKTGGCLCCKCNGDLNEDGDVTPGDALIAFRCYLGSGPCPECSDANLDGEVTPLDALNIFRKYLGKPSSLD